MWRRNSFIFFRTEYLLNFNDKFEIHDDIEILKEMGLSYGELTY